MKKSVKKEVKSARLRNFEGRYKMLDKSRKYLEKELSKVREKEAVLRKHISKEKRAISLINRAKRLR